MALNKKALHNIENIHNSTKTYGILLKYKGFESLESVFIISEKKIIFCFGLWGSHFFTSWAEK